jgi:hypothetical protein
MSCLAVAKYFDRYFLHGDQNTKQVKETNNNEDGGDTCTDPAVEIKDGELQEEVVVTVMPQTMRYGAPVEQIKHFTGRNTHTPLSKECSVFTSMPYRWGCCK